MNIQIKKIKTDNGESTYKWILADKKSKDLFDILTKQSFANAKEVIKDLSKHTFLILYAQVEWWSDDIGIIFFTDKLHDRVVPSIEFSLQFQDWENWNKPWSMSSFAKQFELNIAKLNNKNILYSQEDSDSMLNGQQQVLYSAFVPAETALLYIL